MLGVKETLEEETGLSGDIKENIKESLIKGSPLDVYGDEEKKAEVADDKRDETGRQAAEEMKEDEAEAEKDG